jgi:hypothetical protein
MHRHDDFTRASLPELIAAAQTERAPATVIEVASRVCTSIEEYQLKLDGLGERGPVMGRDILQVDIDESHWAGITIEALANPNHTCGFILTTRTGRRFRLKVEAIDG